MESRGSGNRILEEEKEEDDVSSAVNSHAVEPAARPEQHSTTRDGREFVSSDSPSAIQARVAAVGHVISDVENGIYIPSSTIELDAVTVSDDNVVLIEQQRTRRPSLVNSRSALSARTAAVAHVISDIEKGIYVQRNDEVGLDGRQQAISSHRPPEIVRQNEEHRVQYLEPRNNGSVSNDADEGTNIDNIEPPNPDLPNENNSAPAQRQHVVQQSARHSTLQLPQPNRQEPDDETHISLVDATPINDRTIQHAIRVVSAAYDEEEEHSPWQRHKRKILFAVALFLLVAIIIAGVCGSGQCSGKSASEPERITGLPTNSPGSTTTAVPSPSTQTVKAFKDTSELYDAVDIYIEYSKPNSTTKPKDSAILQQYGYPIGTWDVSHISDFSFIFDARRDPDFSFDKNDYSSPFDADLSGWNVLAATTMHAMFSYANSFTSNLTSWDTSKVTDMSEMFSSASAFNGDLSTWNTSSVTNMLSMFSFASSFDGDISNWDTGQVTDMSLMFESANWFHGNISSWNTGKSMLPATMVLMKRKCRWSAASVSMGPHDLLLMGAGSPKATMVGWRSVR